VRVEIVTIGDELCRGEIVDTNSSWMAAQLWERGVTVGWMTSCRDDAEDMRRALREAVARALPTLERLYLEDLMRTSDAVEGVAAFIEKRPPRWRDQ
jgi:enoyl-CoA hydratase/carnithine racemase